MNVWNMKTGQLVEKRQVEKDYRGYDVDRKVYDKGWFPYTLIHKVNPHMENDDGFASDTI